MLLTCPWRSDFPALAAFASEGQSYLDSAATAQTPQTLLTEQGIAVRASQHCVSLSLYNDGRDFAQLFARSIKP